MKNNTMTGCLRNIFRNSLFLLLFLVASLAVAQEVEIDPSLIPITGKVYNSATGSPMAGARVTAFGQSQYAAMSDESGSFTLQIPATVNLLQANAPGYNLVLFPLRGQTENLDIKLHSAAFKTDYTDKIEIAATNSTTDFSNTASLSADMEIQSKLGTDVRAITRSGAPGIGAAMFIRGLNSLNTSAQPLIVLDGIVLDMQEDRSSLHDGYFNNILSSIDVNDIEKITVLKNATTLYGAKGSNGVIVIETKRGKSMATRIDVSIAGGIATQPKMPSMMNAEQYRRYASDIWAGTGSQTVPHFLNDNKNFFYYNNYHNNTNWQDNVYREAFTQSYNVGVQGGDNVAMYNLSLGYTTAQSTLEDNNFTRFNTRFNTDVVVAKNFTTRFDVSYVQTSGKMRDDGAPEDYNSAPIVAPGFLSLIKAPFLSPYQYDNNRQLTNKLEDADYFKLANPYSVLEYGMGESEYSRFNVIIEPRYKFTNTLEISSIFGYTLARSNEKYFRPMTGVAPFYMDGIGVSNNQAKSLFSKQNSLFSDTRLQWKQQFSSHNLSVFGGFRFMNDKYASNFLSGHNTGNDKIVEVISGLSYRTVGGINDTWRSMNYYANAAYNYQEKYFLEGTVSAETSSRFGKEAADGVKAMGVPWAIFPSVQAGWLISSESFLKDVSFLDYMKLTAGFDRSGNDGIGDFVSRTYFSSIKFLDKAIGLEISNLKNPAIQWETTKRFNIGLNMNLFDNRLNVDANIYKSTTDNLLTLKQYDYIAGLENYWSNEGSLKNHGFEVAVAAKVLNTRDVKWELGASIARYKNEITSLPDNKSYLTSIYGAEVLTEIGRPAGVFYGYKTNGVFANAGEVEAAELSLISSTGTKIPFQAGDIHFQDLHKDNIIDEKDKTVIGDPNPDFYGNIFTTVNYKRFSLNVLFNYSYGNDVYNYLRSQLESGSRFHNQTTALLNRWMNEGQKTDIPRIAHGDPMGNSRFSDRWIEDGSYIRLKTVTLSYQLPLNLSWLQAITIWGSANNLLTFSKYLGSDPEFSINNNVLYQGIDRGLLPQSRNFHLGVKINL